MAARRRRRSGSGGAVNTPGNLLRDLPDAGAAEITDAILALPGLRIERIVSLGQTSPPGFWYDQKEAEFVVLLAGAARLRFADEDEDRALGPGDWVHRRAPAPSGQLDRSSTSDGMGRRVSLVGSSFTCRVVTPSQTPAMPLG